MSEGDGFWCGRRRWTLPLVLLAVGIAAGGCPAPPEAGGPGGPGAGGGPGGGEVPDAPRTGEWTTASGLFIEEVQVGEGEAAAPGDQVFIHYTGMRADGSMFDSSYDRDSPYLFNLGRGEVLRAWDEGVAGMRVGGRRKITAPPSLTFGDTPPPGMDIEPGTTLSYIIELVEIR